MNKYLSLRVWSPSELVMAVFVAAALLAATSVIPATVLSRSAVFAGMFGALLLRHLALHGWTLLNSSMAQRAALVALWLIAVAIGGALSTMMGF